MKTTITENWPTSTWGLTQKRLWNHFPFIAGFLFRKKSVQFSYSVVSDSATPWTAAHHASLSITSSWSLLKLKSIESVMPSNHLILCCPLLLPPPVFPSIRVFPNESVLRISGQSIGISASASVLPMSIQDRSPLGWTGCIFLQSKTLKSLLQHHCSKASVFWCSAFFIVQLSHPYMTTGKTIALTRWTFVDKVNVSAFLMCCLAWS